MNGCWWGHWFVGLGVVLDAIDLAVDVFATNDNKHNSA